MSSAVDPKRVGAGLAQKVNFWLICSEDGTPVGSSADLPNNDGVVVNPPNNPPDGAEKPVDRVVFATVGVAPNENFDPVAAVSAARAVDEDVSALKANGDAMVTAVEASPPNNVDGETVGSVSAFFATSPNGTMVFNLAASFIPDEENENAVDGAPPKTKLDAPGGAIVAIPDDVFAAMGEGNSEFVVITFSRRKLGFAGLLARPTNGEA